MRVLLVLMLVAGTAAAQPTTAADHFEKGKRLYAVKEYAAAIAEFKQAYTLDPDPAYLFNIAQAYRLAADCAQATDFFQRFLRAVPSSTKRARIEAWIAECKPAARPARAHEPVPEPVPVPETAPPPVIVTKPPPSRVPVEAIDRDPGRWQRVAGIATAASGAALLLVGGGLAIKVSGTESDLESACRTSCDWAEIRERDASARTQAVASKVLLGVGGAALVGGAGLYFWGRYLGREAPVALAPTSGGAMVMSGFSF